MGYLHLDQSVSSVSSTQALYPANKFVRKSFILSKNIWEDNDSIMANCGFTIKKEHESLNMILDIPLLLSSRSQLLKDEVTEGQSIVSTRANI